MLGQALWGREETESYKSDSELYTAGLGLCSDLTVTESLFSSVRVRKCLFIFILQEPTVERLWSFRETLERLYVLERLKEIEFLN